MLQGRTEAEGPQRARILSTHGPREAEWELVLLPNVGGVRSPLDSGLSEMARRLGNSTRRVSIVQFPGQNGDEGEFSVYTSCRQARDLLSSIHSSRRVVLFGVCSGGLAALWAASEGRVDGVFCWDTAPFYPYCPDAIATLTKRLRVRFDRDTMLVPVQATDLLVKVDCPVRLGFPENTRVLEWERDRLASLAAHGRTEVLCGTGHYPGRPAGSAEILANALERFVGLVDRERRSGPRDHEKVNGTLQVTGNDVPVAGAQSGRGN